MKRRSHGLVRHAHAVSEDRTVMPEGGKWSGVEARRNAEASSEALALKWPLLVSRVQRKATLLRQIIPDPYGTRERRVSR